MRIMQSNGSQIYRRRYSAEQVELFVVVSLSRIKLPIVSVVHIEPSIVDPCEAGKIFHCRVVYGIVRHISSCCME